MKKTLFITGMLFSCLTLAATGSYGIRAEQEFLINSEYNLGDTFIVPEYKEGGVTYTHSVMLPNEEQSSDKEIPLNIPGIYNIVYMNGSNIKEYSFTVKNPLYSFSGNKSSASYQSYALNPTKKGLMVNLAEGETITFNNVFDLSKYSSACDFISFFIAPEVKGRSEFTMLNLTLTDIEDPENLVKFRVKHYANDTAGDHFYSYACASAYGQPLVGYEAGWDKVHVNDEWGTAFYHSFFANYNNGKLPGDYSCTLSLSPFSGETKVNGSLISDLNDPKFYSNIWEGFKTNKVKLSISGSSYSMSSGHFMITSLLESDLTKEYISDREAPEITVNCGDTIPNGLAGFTYPVFEATAMDRYSGTCKVHPAAYYDYGKSTQKYIPIKNGSFYTEKAGDYTIVYTSKDYFGNKQTKKVNVTVLSALDNLSIAPKTLIDLNSPVGEKFTLPEFNVVGGTGEYKTAYYLVKDGIKTLINEDYFRPETIGNYKIQFVVTDFIGQTASYDIDLNVVENSTPVFYDDANLPKYFISGSEYLIPEVFAYDFSSGSKKPIKAQVEILDANLSSKVINSGEKFTPLAYDNGASTTLVFKANGAEKSYNVPTFVVRTVVSGRDRIMPSNYFANDGFSIDNSVNDYLTFSATKNDSTWEFINPLLAENLSISFVGMPSYANKYNGINFTIVDTQNIDEKLTIKLVKKQGKIEYQYGNKSFMSTSSFESSDESSFTFGYKNNCVQAGNALLPIATYDNGKPFAGFSSMKVYLSSSFIEGKTGAKYGIASLNNQILSGISSDRVGPSIAIQGNYGGTKSINDVISLPKAFAADVFDPNVELKMTVTTPSQKVAKDVNGLLLENVDPTSLYTVKFDEYGQYVVSYSAKDIVNANPNTTKLSYAINIADEIKPTISFKSECQKSIKVNEFIIIPDIEVSDNVSSKFTIIKSIKSPSGYTTFFEGSTNSMKAIYEGIYEIRVLVLDEAGNISTLSAKVSVSK